MELTEKLLEQRIAEIEGQKTQLIANASACSGAIAVLRQLVADLDKVESKEENASEVEATV